MEASAPALKNISIQRQKLSDKLDFEGFLCYLLLWSRLEASTLAILPCGFRGFSKLICCLLNNRLREEAIPSGYQTSSGIFW
jgi:hypothetical protein